MSSHRILTTLAVVLLVGVLAGGVVVVSGSRAESSADAVTFCQVANDELGGETTAEVRESDISSLLSETSSYVGPCAAYGASADFGKGRIAAFSQTDSSGTPAVVGFVADDIVFDNLPYDPPSMGLWCFDQNGDGAMDPHRDCAAGGYEHALLLNEGFRRLPDIPFTYVLWNWMPDGHGPKGAWDVPHFDVHFYLNENAERLAIRPGRCKETDCDDYALAKVLPEEKYRHPDFADRDGVKPGMGLHLADTTSPESHGHPATHTLIYGSFNGEITFYEPMVTLAIYDDLRSGRMADSCFPIKQPQAWQRTGWYPTEYCLRHRQNRAETLTTLEKFVYREAS